MPAASHHLSIDVSHLSWIAHTILQHFYKNHLPGFVRNRQPVNQLNMCHGSHIP